MQKQIPPWGCTPHQGVLAGQKGVSSLSAEGVQISAIKSTYQSQLQPTRPDADNGPVWAAALGSTTVRYFFNASSDTLSLQQLQ